MKNHIRPICSTLLLVLLVAFGLQAQSEFKKGSIQLTKKKSMDAYILIDFTKPHHFQSSLTYLTPKDYDKYVQKGKLKNSQKEELKPKDFLGFTLEDGTTFKTVKYIDLTKKGVGMLPKRLCLEQVASGKIDMYKMYSKTNGKMSYELADVIFESKKKGNQILIDYIQDNFQLLVQKDTKNPKNVVHINLLNLIGDNEEVKTKYDGNHYGLREQFSDQGGVIVNKRYEAAFLRLLEDYNGTSGVSK